MAILFGAGNLYLVPPGTTVTPQKVGTLQEVSLDMSFESKELYGNKQFPVMVARSKGKITGKAKTGEFKGALISSILAGSTVTTGRKLRAQHADTAIPGTPYQLTVTHSAQFSEDLGVFNTTSGLYMTRVASAPATGQYSVSAGVYTFAAADTTNVVRIEYTYTDTTGSTILYSNQLMGSQTIYQAHLYNTNPDGSQFGLKLKSVVFPKMSLAFKNDDFTMPDLDLSAFASSDDSIAEFYSPE